MTLCAERKPLSYMTAGFNFLEHSLYTETGPFSYIPPFCVLKKWMSLVSCKRHKGCDCFLCMPFANGFKCVSIHSYWTKKFPHCTPAFFNSSCKRHNRGCSQGTLSADSGRLSVLSHLPFLCHADACAF